MEDVKAAVRNFNQAEVLHLLNHLYNTRDDILFLYAMTRQEIKMDEQNLHDFKAWLTENRDIVMACIESALPTSVPTDDDGTSDTNNTDTSSTASCSNAVGGNGGE